MVVFTLGWDLVTIWNTSSHSLLGSPPTLLSQLHVWTGRWIQHVQKYVLCISNSLLSLEAEWLESAIFYCYFFAVFLLQCSFRRGLKVTYCTLLRRVKIFPSSTDQPRKDNKTIMKKLSYPWSRVTRFLSRRVLKRGRGMILTNWTDCCYFKA